MTGGAVVFRAKGGNEWEREPSAGGAHVGNVSTAVYQMGPASLKLVKKNCKNENGKRRRQKGVWREWDEPPPKYSMHLQ
eukprot:7375818-Prymnesium_polylepis.1